MPRGRRGGPACRSPCCSPRRTTDGGPLRAPSRDRARSWRSPTRRRSSGSTRRHPRSHHADARAPDRAIRPPGRARARARAGPARAAWRGSTPAGCSAGRSRARWPRPRRPPAREPGPPGRAGRASRGAASSNRAGPGWACCAVERRRPRPPPDQPGDRGLLRRHRRRLRPPLARTRSRARAWGGDLSRLLLLRRLGDRDAALLADPRRLAGQPPQEVELGAAHATLADQLDLRDRRRMQRENALDADARRDLADGERRVDPGAAAADADALERLQSLLVALAYPHHHPDGVARIERRDVGLEPLALDRPQSVHSLFSLYASLASVRLRV